MSRSKSIFCTCGPFKPKWMKMVDNIYKSTLNDNSSHSKLVYFCVRKPDKLDRIAAYLHKHLANNIYRCNNININLTMDAINSLMNACHSQRLNLFVVTFLKMVQLLVESNVYDLQLLGSRSFVQFSHIAEDTPNYHREYEYLINHFAKMALDNSDNELERNKLRVAGISGINGIVRKSTMDQLQMNVLDIRCLNMILPALLFNMALNDETTQNVTQYEEHPSKEAISVFKDIICRASFTNIQPVIISIITYIDGNKLWNPSQFTLFVVDIFLESIRNPQGAHSLMKQLVTHLGNEDNQFSPQEKTGVVKAINKTVVSLAAQAVGPDIFHNFKSLLQILRQSIESIASKETNKESSIDRSVFRKPADNTQISENGPLENSVDPEKVFQEAIISTIAEFAKNLPDTQKIEIMKFILNFDSLCFDKANRSKQLIRVLLKTMLQVATQYKTGSISNVFNADFLNLLLNGVAVDKDPGNRIFVQKILHTLIDRHENTIKLNHIMIIDRDTLVNTLKVEKPPARQDIVFMKKTGAIIIENLFLQIIDQSNKVDNLENIYTTLSLITLEMGADQVVVDLFRLIFAAQKYVSDPSNKMPVTHQCAVHALLSAFITILGLVSDLTKVQEHVAEVIDCRQKSAKYYLPEVAFNRSNTSSSYPTKVNCDEKLLFSEDLVKAELSANGYDNTTFENHFILKAGEPSSFLNMAQDQTRGNNDLSASMVSLSISEGSTIIDDDNKSLKGTEEDICSFASIQKLISETPEARRTRKRNTDLELNKYFREAGFEKICKDQREKDFPIRQQLMEIINNGILESKNAGEYNEVPNVYEIDYPKLFVV